MLADFRQLDSKAIEADLCIIGAGAAGITLARALIGTGIRICLLESGGLDYEPDVQALYEGEDAGFRQSFGVDHSRLRYFGGATNHWVGRCAPLSELDFRARPWLPHSGWPIGRQDLDPYYRRAQTVLEVGTYRYMLTDFADRYRRVPDLDAGKLVARVVQLSPPTRFGQKYRSDLEGAANVAAYLHANVTELETASDGSHVRAARLRTLDGKTGVARARVFVLATGGIENARLLLLSNRTEPKGLGNRNDLVGRFYMDHLRVERTAVAYVESERPFDTLVGDFISDGVRFETELCPSEGSQRRDETLNWTAELHWMPEAGEWAAALRDVRDALRAGKWPDDFGRKMWTVLSDLDSAAKGTYRRLFEAKPLAVLARCETAPDPESRITLTQERDALGQNKVRRVLRVAHREKETLRKAMRLLGEELGRLNLGRVKLADWLAGSGGDWPADLWGGVHHVGTTRMASDPGRGVVDANCRVHGVANLYVAGSSVFPTAGSSHPTLTIVALALRLGDHLKHVFRGDRVAVH
jgi:choline dehydrogenase-like flavoprotein